jgi:hypothetical protein
VKPENHAECKGFLRGQMAELGIEIVVSTAPPLVPSPWTEHMVCPHGTTFYYEPTSEQRAAWVRDGVA